MKSKNKKMLFLLSNLLVVVGLGLIVGAFFVPFWSNHITLGNVTTTYGLFESFEDVIVSTYELANGNFYGYCTTIVQIATIVALTALALYVLVFVVQLLNKKNKHLVLIKQILAFISLLATLIVFIFVIIFTAKNVIYAGGDIVESVSVTTGFFLFAVGSVIASLFALLGAKRK